jgi:chromosome segregation ATPase
MGVIKAHEERAANAKADRQAMEHAAAEHRKIARDNDLAAGEIDGLRAQLKAAEQRVIDEQTAKDKLVRHIQTFDERITAIQATVKRVSDEKAHLQGIYEEAKAEVGRLQARAASQTADATKQSETVTELKRQKAQLEDALQALDFQSGEKAGAVSRAHNKINELTADKDKLNKLLDDAANQIRYGTTHSARHDTTRTQRALPLTSLSLCMLRRVSVQ